MHVFRFFLNTLLLVAAVVGSVLSFIYRDEVMQKAAALSGTVMTLLHEQGWLATSPIVRQSAVAEPPEQATAVRIEPLSEIIPPVAESPPTVNMLPLVSEVAKEDYPSESYVPVGPESDAKNTKDVKKRIIEIHDPLSMDLIPPGELNGEGANITSVPEKEGSTEGQKGQLPKLVQLPQTVHTNGEGHGTAVVPSSTIPMANSNSFVSPLDGFPPSQITEEKGESQAAQGASHGASGAEWTHPFPWFPPPGPPLSPPSVHDRKQEEGWSDENRMAQITPPWIRPSLSGSHPSMPSQPATGATGGEPRPQTSSAASSAVVITRDQPPVALREAWIAARRAFWEQNPFLAEKAYQALIRDYPDEPDLPGELGNIYLHQGRWPEATDLYYEAGLRALRSFNRGRVNAVIRILRSLDPTKAEVLRQKTAINHTPG